MQGDCKLFAVDAYANDKLVNCQTAEYGWIIVNAERFEKITQKIYLSIQNNVQLMQEKHVQAWAIKYQDYSRFNVVCIIQNTSLILKQSSCALKGM